MLTSINNVLKNITVVFSIILLATTFLFFSKDALSFDAASFKQNHPNMQGKIVKTRQFMDKMGENFIFLNSTDNYKLNSSDGDDFISKDIFAYAYRGKNEDDVKLLWKMNDFVHDCMNYPECEYSKDSPIITDLNSNGIKEVWLITYLGCRGDVSPITMKILMYENGKKYALRGKTFVHVDGMDLGGKYKADEAFAKAPKEFVKFANDLWQKHKKF